MNPTFETRSNPNVWLCLGGCGCGCLMGVTFVALIGGLIWHTFYAAP